jgi:hypothetical protein
LAEAEEQLRRTVDMDSSFKEAQEYLALVHLAVAELERVGARAWIAHPYARAGRREDALRITRELEARSRRGEWVSPLSIASIYAALGDADSAFEWLGRAYDTQEPDMIFIAVEPRFGPLRGDPRLASLARRVGGAGDSKP